MYFIKVFLCFYVWFFCSENDIEMSAQEEKQTIADLKMSFDEKATT